MKSSSSLPLQGDRVFTRLGTGHHGRYLQETQVQHRNEMHLDLDLDVSWSSNDRSRRPVLKIFKSNDKRPPALDPGTSLPGGVDQESHVEHHKGLGREAGRVVIAKVRCLCDNMSGIRRCVLDLYRCSITKMVDLSICVVAVEPRLACLNRYPSSSAESTSFFLYMSAGPRSLLRSAWEMCMIINVASASSG